MTIKLGSIVVRKGEYEDELSNRHYRVEMIVGNMASIRDLTTFLVSKEPVDMLRFVYQTDSFSKGDFVRVRSEYKERYGEVNGENRLVVEADSTSTTASITSVKNLEGDVYNILTERLYLVKPAVSFKEGDRVVIDPELVKKYPNDSISHFWTNVGVLVLTEDSGSRQFKLTSHVRYEDRDDHLTNNAPTRWLKLVEEPAKRVVGEEIKAEDVKVGDKITATDTVCGLRREFTGVVAGISILGGMTILRTADYGLFPHKDAVYVLLEEAPEPVDENLQRLLDAEIGDLVYGTYADDYWRKVGEDGWKMLDDRHIHDTETVFYELFGMKYGELHIYRKVEVAD